MLFRSIVNVVLYLIVLFCLSTYSLDFGLISYAYAYAVSNVISGAVFQVLFEFLFWPRFMRDEL